MTIQRKQKQEIRAFMAEHNVPYREALRLLDFQPAIWSSITDSDGTEYTIWIRGDQLDVFIAVSDTEEAVCQGSFWRWMTGNHPGDPEGSYRKPFYAPDGRVQSILGSESLYELDEMPWLPSSVPPLIRAYIRKNFPAWDRYTQSTLRWIDYSEANPQRRGGSEWLFPRRPAPPVELD